MRLLSGRPDVYLDLDGPTPKHKVDGGPARIDTCARRLCQGEIAVWVFERNICLSVLVRVVSVAAGLGRGHSRIVSPAEPSGEPLGRRVPLAYVSSERISGALRSLALPPIPRASALWRGPPLGYVYLPIAKVEDATSYRVCKHFVPRASAQEVEYVSMSTSGSCVVVEYVSIRAACSGRISGCPTNFS